MDITVIILTYNEAIHIERCINSLIPIAKEIHVVDSNSTDSTVEISEKLGAKVFKNDWINYANQFQWALDNTNIKTKWVLRIDADEYISEELSHEISNLEETYFAQNNITGLYINRQLHFMGKWIKYGGYYPVKLLRLWRFEYGKIEDRWMDEHTILSHGQTTELKYDLMDCNLNNISWWIQKHNSYATREAIDILNRNYNLFDIKSIPNKLSLNKQDLKVRWFKENLFLKFPKLIRPFFYFIYRYFFRLGILDGKKGLIWHLLQGFWYRFLVDSKIEEILYLSAKKNKSVKEIIQKEYHVKLE